MSSLGSASKNGGAALAERARRESAPVVQHVGIVRRTESTRSFGDHRFKVTEEVHEYRNADGREYRVSYETRNGETPRVMARGTMKEINAQAQQWNAATAGKRAQQQTVATRETTATATKAPRIANVAARPAKERKITVASRSATEGKIRTPKATHPFNALNKRIASAGDALHREMTERMQTTLERHEREAANTAKGYGKPHEYQQHNIEAARYMLSQYAKGNYAPPTLSKPGKGETPLEAETRTGRDAARLKAYQYEGPGSFGTILPYGNSPERDALSALGREAETRYSKASSAANEYRNTHGARIGAQERLASARAVLARANSREAMRLGPARTTITRTARPENTYDNRKKIKAFDKVEKDLERVNKEAESPALARSRAFFNSDKGVLLRTQIARTDAENRVAWAQFHAAEPDSTAHRAALATLQTLKARSRDLLTQYRAAENASGKATATRIAKSK